MIKRVESPNKSLEIVLPKNKEGKVNETKSL